MNIEQAHVEVRQRSQLEVTDLSFRYVFALGGKLYAKLWLAYCPPLVLLLWAAQRWLGWSWVTIWVLAAIAGSGLQGLFTVAAGRLMFETKVSFGAVTRQYFSRMGAYLGALIITRLMLIASSFLLIPLPFVWVRVAHVHEAVLLEGASAGAAVKRAGRFTEHYAGATFSMLMLLCCITVGIMASSQIVGDTLVTDVFQLGNIGGDIEDGGTFYLLVGYFLSILFCATMRFLAYIDARTRRDGWDVQVRFMALRAQAEEAL